MPAATDKKRILWVDDEIDLLRSHILFLEQRGYAVLTAPNGDDALELVEQGDFDMVLLDEQMPGKNGLAVAEDIRRRVPSMPVVMITKSEEEALMDRAIGQRVDDYIVKPVNPNQVLSVLKKLLEGDQIRHQRIARDFSRRYLGLEEQRKGLEDWRGWVDAYRELLSWELRLIEAGERGLLASLEDLQRGYSRDFAAWYSRSYAGWVQARERERPPISPSMPPLSMDVVPDAVLPLLRDGRRVLFVIVDCLRLDQWLTIADSLTGLYEIEESFYFSILPSATPYSRNAIFSGLFPRGIAQRYPQYWRDVRDEGSLNLHERELLAGQLARHGVDASQLNYQKVFTAEEGAQVERKLPNLLQAQFTVLVFNFIDILTHGRSESDILKEIAPDQEAFRSLTRSWFLHSSLRGVLEQAARMGVTVVLTSDHGSVHCKRPATVFAKRDATENLRFKFGDHVRSEEPSAFVAKRGADVGLPDMGPRTHFLFAAEDYYLVYPTKLREYQGRYYGSFLHGGISLDEMVLPLVTLSAR
ncbi:MAG: response regulator [Gemmatimonadetes bacterium]|nr:response regulator [Gemmatimonadota bacterium]